VYKVKVTVRSTGNLTETHEHIVTQIKRLSNGSYVFIAGDEQEGRQWEYGAMNFIRFEKEALDVA